MDRYEDWDGNDGHHLDEGSDRPAGEKGVDLERSPCATVTPLKMARKIEILLLWEWRDRCLIGLLLLASMTDGAPKGVGYFAIKNQRFRFFIRTPAPPPFSGMNSTPAFSSAAANASPVS